LAGGNRLEEGASRHYKRIDVPCNDSCARFFHYVHGDIVQELENIAMTQLSGLKKARQLQSLAILIARIGSEMRITLDILRGLQGAHNEFYEIVLKKDSISSRPPIYHRLQSDFRNLAETFNSRLIEVIELDSRIRSCISSVCIFGIH
jgi:hypothetical protein